jgi:hypothetical protein
MRRRGLEPPPGYPGPGPQPGNPGVISVRIAPDRPYRPVSRTIRTQRTVWTLPRMLPRPRAVDGSNRSSGHADVPVRRAGAGGPRSVCLVAGSCARGGGDRGRSDQATRGLPDDDWARMRLRAEAPTVRHVGLPGASAAPGMGRNSRARWPIGQARRPSEMHRTEQAAASDVDTCWRFWSTQGPGERRGCGGRGGMRHVGRQSPPTFRPPRRRSREAPRAASASPRAHNDPPPPSLNGQDR